MNYKIEISYTIEQFRKSRGYTIKDLINGIISRPQYFRFINGNSIRAEQLFLFLDRLNVSLDEFETQLGRNVNSNYYSYQKEIQSAFVRGDTESLTKFAKLTYHDYQNNHMTKFLHLHVLCEIYCNRIKQLPLSTDSQILSEYLLQLENWQLYDIELFTNCFFCFSDQTISALTFRLEKDILKYDFSDHRMKAIVALFCNLCLINIEHQNFNRAITFIKKINDLSIPNEFMLERLFQLFFSGLEKIINHKVPEGITSCKSALDCLSCLGMGDYEVMLSNALEFTIQYS